MYKKYLLQTYEHPTNEYVLDSAADLSSIEEEEPGSTAIDCATGNLYILSPSKEWREI